MNSVIPNERWFLRTETLLPGSRAAYRERVNADQREEIAASVAAHAELGPKYDSAVAEGLVERIGEEIDKRIDARLRGLGQQQAPRQPYLSPGHQIVPPGYLGGQAVPGPGPAAAPPAPAPAAAQAAAPAQRSNGVSGVFLGLGSMGLGVGATSVVVSHNMAAGTSIVLVLLIWFAIATINIAHSQRR
jgi:hypothetical protein